MKAALNIGWIAAMTGLLACGDGGGKTKGTIATLEAFDDGLTLAVGGVIGVSPGTVAVGDEVFASELRLINTGEGNLVISSIDIISEPPGVYRLAGDRDGATPVPDMPVTIAPQFDIEGKRSVSVYLMFTRPASGVTPTGRIEVRSNSVNGDESRPLITFDVRLQNTAPSIQVTPRAVNFETVQNGKSSLKTINVLNPGAETLRVNSFILSGHPNFELIISGVPYPVSAASAAGLVLETPLEVEPGNAVAVDVRYTADDPSEARGQVVFFSNDPTQVSGTPVTLQANVGGPCISVNPRKVAFGGKLIGKKARIEVEVTSCGDQPLEITGIELTPDSSTLYALSLDALPGVTGAPTSIGPSDAPVVLQPNAKATLTVEYLPEVVSPVDTDNQPVYDTATLRIRSNSFQPELLVDITGFGVLKECPTAVIEVQEGEEVVPQTVLHLIGSQSTAATGQIAEHHWDVDAPVGALPIFLPSDSVPDPRFEVNVAGTYVFSLTVVDETNEPSCVPATYTVVVNPDEAIHIELLWDTPNDPDQTDEQVGADLDMHFTHPLAVGGYDGDADGEMDGWFDLPFDCFWHNEQPNWASIDQTVDDNPGLDRDDTDGVGPENLNLNKPENGISYSVGVHYWDDHSFGTSYATIRVYLFANLVFEMAEVELFKHDMWWVTDIAWPPTGTPPQLTKVCGGRADGDAVVTCESDADCGAAKCGLRITPNYRHPEFFQP